MFFYLIRRIAYAIPIALAVGFVCFMLVQIAPGDPINAIVPPDAPGDVVEQVRRDYGLDKPLPVQFGLWLMKVVQPCVRRYAVVRPCSSRMQSASALN
jgi:peptide/nickel transport system permease protein